jgi:hypothetical protein
MSAAAAEFGDEVAASAVAANGAAPAESWGAIEAEALGEPVLADDPGLPEAAGEVGEPVPAELVRLAAAVAALDEVTSLPVAEHVRRYDALHGELSDALASIDEV